MNGFASVAGIVSSIATCIALVFAGVEFRRSRAQDRRRRQVEIGGVAVSWRRLYGPVTPGSNMADSEAPRTAPDAQGRAAWEYEFTAYNPAELPITDVRVEIHFAIPVARLRYDGHLDDPAEIIILESTPVLAGHGSRTWRRTLVMNYEEAPSALPQTKALISFVEPEEAQHHTNYWPKQLWDNPLLPTTAAATPASSAALAPGHPSNRRP
jgi:hypothetical protein